MTSFESDYSSLDPTSLLSSSTTKKCTCFQTTKEYASFNLFSFFSSILLFYQSILAMKSLPFIEGTTNNKKPRFLIDFVEWVQHLLDDLPIFDVRFNYIIYTVFLPFFLSYIVFWLAEPKLDSTLCFFFLGYLLF